MTEAIHTENTINKVHEVLCRNGYTPDEASDVITDMQNAGILFRERGPEFPDMEFEGKDLEQCVYEALGAASGCWENMSGTGVFQSERCKDIGDQLIKRIRQAQPIYG